MINTRTLDRPDGGREIIRVLDEQGLKQWKREEPLAFEKSIVWLQPPEALDFARVAWIHNAKSRRGRLSCDGPGMILGYSKLTADAPRNPATNAYTRRLFYLKDDDFDLNMNQFPRGAVNPCTILPGLIGAPPDIVEVDRGYPWYLCRGGVMPESRSWLNS